MALPVAAKAETIDSFDVVIRINPDSTLQVRERIIYDFGDLPRHGIYRDIPFKYQARGGNFELRFSGFLVTDEAGKIYNFSVSDSGNYKRIKIGDPNVWVSGIQTYVINYTVKRAINYFNDYDELYWNVTGNEWPVSIASASAKVVLPKVVSASRLRLQCFAGTTGSRTACDAMEALPDGTISFRQNFLSKREGLTVVVGFPKQVVTEPSWWEKLIDTAKDNLILFLPVAVFLILFRWWWTQGRDPKGYSTIIAQYEPPADLAPSEAGAILDERVDNRDISADIINLAVRGYLKITRLEEKKFIGKKVDYQLDKLRAEDDLQNGFEKKLMLSLFGQKTSVKLSDHKNKFYKDLTEIKKQIYRSVVNKGFFKKNPATTRKVYLIIGIGVAFAGVWLGALWGGLGILSFILSGAIIIAFSFFMPAKTRRGAKMRDYILGLKEYLSVAEKDRMKFHNAPAKSPERFEKLLPYAMVLRVEKEWAVQFEGIYTQPPAWYNDPSGLSFSALVFAGSLNQFDMQVNSTLASTPRSAASGGSGFGGGFSGGGFGGGGGGSW